MQVQISILCIGGLDVIRKEAWPFYRTVSGVRLCWELEEPEGPKSYTPDRHSDPLSFLTGPSGNHWATVEAADGI